MRATSDPLSSYRASRKPRTLALLLAIGINVLILIMLLTLGPRLVPAPPPKADPPVFQITPDPPESQAAGNPEVPKPGGGETARSRPKDVVTAPPPPPSAPPAPAPTPNMLVLSSEDFAASDIGAIRSRRGEEVADAGTESGDAADSGAAYGPGEGPGGERLYRAEWYRRPSDRELNAYMPPQGAPAGAWAEIACRTVADYRVEDCRELADYPRGSRLAGAIRQAAWQFRVRPPRVGGKPMIGTWVRIRIDFTERPQR